MIKKMQKRIFLNFTIGLLLAVLANGLWLYEIVSVIGWEGLKWLNYEHKSIFVINALVILAYCFPLWRNQEVQAKQEHKLVTFLLLYVLTLIAFYIIKSLFCGPLFDLDILYLPSICLILLVPFLIYWISHKRIHPLKKWQIGPVFLSVLLSILLSNITIEYFPGFGNSSSFIAGTKMGYPYFWITIIMNIIGIWTVEKLLLDPKLEKKLLHEDILDA